MINWFSRRAVPPLAQDYLDGTPPRIPGRTPADEIAFMVLDTETTGFKVGVDRLLSAALVEVQGGRIRVARTFSWLVFQPQAAATAAVAVHGILPSETADGMPEEQVLAEMLPLLRGTVLVGHHIGFDADVLGEALGRHFKIGLRNPMVDTAVMATRGLEAFHRTGYARQRPPSLEEVCANSGVPMVGRHTAAGDTFTAAQVFLLLCGRLQQKLGRPLRAADLPIEPPR